MHVPIAAPFVPNDGIGPRPRISTIFKSRLSTVNAMPSIIGVRASPAERNAPPSMKNTIMPKLNTNMMRRNGRASAFTSGAALTRLSNEGDTKYPIGAITPSAMKTAVRNAWYTVRLTFSSSPAPAKRATSTLIPVNNDEIKTITTRNTCQLTPIAAFALNPTRLPTSAWSTMPCKPPMTFVSIVGHAIFQTAGRSGPSTIDRSKRDLLEISFKLAYLRQQSRVLNLLRHGVKLRRRATPAQFVHVFKK